MEEIVVFIISIIGFVILLYIAKAVFGFSTLKKHAEYQTAILEAIAMKQGCDTLYLRNKAIEIFN